MRTKKFLPLTLLTLVCAACAPCYQIYQIKTPQNAANQNKNLVFEDQYCQISYNFWSVGGEVSFSLYNKTSEPIALDLAKSFFVINDIAHDYFLDRTYTTHTSNSVKGINNVSLKGSIYNYPAATSWASSVQVGSSKGVEHKEQKTTTIPPKSRKIICEYKVNEILYKNCDLSETVTKSNPSHIAFSETTSPYRFENRLTYQIGAEQVELNHKFYVSKITNMVEKSALTYEKPTHCQSHWSEKTKVFQVDSPDRFYLTYDGSTNNYRAKKRQRGDSVEQTPQNDLLY